MVNKTKLSWMHANYTQNKTKMPLLWTVWYLHLPETSFPVKSV